MKQFFKIGIIAGFASMVFTSCLKDTPTTDYSDKAIKPIILVPNGNWPRTQSASPIALDFSTTPYEVRVYARVSWDKPLTKSVDVTFKEDAAAIADFHRVAGALAKRPGSVPPPRRNSGLGTPRRGPSAFRQ